MIYKVEETHLTIAHIKRIYEEAVMHIALTKEIQIDLSAVKKVDSSGIATVISWWQHAGHQGVKCTFVYSPVVKEAFSSYHLKFPEDPKET